MEREKFKTLKIKYAVTAILGFFSVALGAFLAHGLEGRFLEADIKIFYTGVTYQFYHVFALLFCLVREEISGHSYSKAWYAFLVGILLFSGSLYLYSWLHFKFLVFLTPLGGLCFLAGWLLLAFNQLSWTKTSR